MLYIRLSALVDSDALYLARFGCSLGAARWLALAMALARFGCSLASGALYPATISAQRVGWRSLWRSLASLLYIRLLTPLGPKRASAIASANQRAAPTIMPGSSVGSPTSESSDVEGYKCPVCWSSVTEDAVTVQGCGHKFHGTCVFRWMRSGGSNAGDCPVCRRDLDSVDGSPQGIIAGAHAFTSGQLERLDEEDGDDEQEHEQGDDVQNQDQEEEPAQSSSGPSSEGNTSRSELDADADDGGSNDDCSGGGGDGGAHNPNAYSAMAEHVALLPIPPRELDDSVAANAAPAPAPTAAPAAELPDEPPAPSRTLPLSRTRSSVSSDSESSEREVHHRRRKVDEQQEPPSPNK